MSELNVILLAGGSSSRFAPLTEKPLYKFLGSTITEIQLQNLKKLDPKRIIIIGNDSNVATFSEITKDDSSVLVREQIGEGMSGAVNTALKEIPEDEEVLVLNVNDIFEDHLLTGFADFLTDLRSQKHNGMVAYYTENYFPGGYLVLDEGKNVQKIMEKPGAGNEPSPYVKLVFDYFRSSKELAEFMSAANSDRDDVYEVALTNIIQSGIVFRFYDYKGLWKAIKFPWQVLDAMEMFLMQIDGQQIADDAVIADTAVLKGNVIIAKGVKIFDNAVINGPVYIGENTIIANNALVRNSMIGANCVIGFGSEVARSYFLEEVWLHMNYVGDSIIEKNVSFGSGALTANLRLDEQNIHVNVKDELTDSGKNKLGAIIGSDVRLGVGSKLMPGIKIGRGSAVGPNVVIDKDLPANSYAYYKPELKVSENKIDIGGMSREKLKKLLEKK